MDMFACITQVEYISVSVKLNESSFLFSNDPKFSRQESTNQSDFIILLEKFQAVSFSLDTPQITQSAADQRHSLETFETSKESQNLDQGKTQQNLSTDMISNNRLSSPHSNHQPQANDQPSSHIIVPNTKRVVPSHPMVTRSKAEIFKPKLYQISTQPQIALLSNTSESLKEPSWKKTMEDEYNALIKNETWTLIPNYSSYKLIRNKWVYRVKENPYGTINKYKARSVVKGFLQIPYIDFTETFNPIVKAATIRIILTLAVNNDWMLRQVDINNAFLNGELTKMVYMPQPEGFMDKSRLNHICILKKALYGLRQAPRAWFDKLKGALNSWGFENSKCDTSLFFRMTKFEIVILLIYVDDIIITGDNSSSIEELVSNLNKDFALKDLGNFFLKIQVNRNQNTILLSQTKYVQDLLAKTEMSNCKGIEPPFSTTEKLKKNEGEKFHDPTLYRSVIGSLQYTILTRPEFAYLVNKLSQYISDPRQPH
ncbi:hypothetical protein WN943_002190 [Citrus x changshan-huyou]